MKPAGATEPFTDSDGSNRSGSRRAVEGATLVIIAATFITVIASSWPIVITWIDEGRPEAARPGLARVLRSRGWAVGTPRAQRPRIEFRDAPPHGVPLPGLDPLLRGDPLGDAEPDEGESLVGAVAKPLTIVQLLDRADPDGRPVISVNPNETLMVVREMTPWVLLAVKRDGRVEFGWTTRSQVAISR